MKSLRHFVGHNMLSRFGQFLGLMLAGGMALFFIEQMGGYAWSYASGKYMPFSGGRIERIIEIGSGDRCVVYAVLHVDGLGEVAIRGGVERRYIVRHRADDAELAYDIGMSMPVYLGIDRPILYYGSQILLCGVAVLFFTGWGALMRDLLLREKINSGRSIGVLLNFDKGNSYLGILSKIVRRKVNRTSQPKHDEDQRAK